MAKVGTIITLTADEVNRNIPYALVCMTRYGKDWKSGRRKRRWEEEFDEEEREDAERLFVLSHRWLLVTGVPETVQMTAEDFCLWIKLGRFCSSV